MKPPEPSLALLRALSRCAVSRGVPAADAEDLVVASWEKAQHTWSPSKGPFDAFARRIAGQKAIDWWRTAMRRREVPVAGLQLASAQGYGADYERVDDNQRRLLAALSADERRVFAAWALQKHLPQGQLTADDAAARVGLTVPEYNNAKRRLKARIQDLAASWGRQPRAFFTLADQEGPRPGVRHAG